MPRSRRVSGTGRRKFLAGQEQVRVGWAAHVDSRPFALTRQEKREEDATTPCFSYDSPHDDVRCLSNPQDQVAAISWKTDHRCGDLDSAGKRQDRVGGCHGTTILSARPEPIPERGERIHLDLGPTGLHRMEALSTLPMGAPKACC